MNMKTKKIAIIAAIAAIGAVTAFGHPAACEARRSRGTPSTVAPPVTAQQPDSCRIASLTRLAEGTSPDLSADGRLIAFNRKIDDVYEIFLMNADGSSPRCLTRDSIPQELRGRHKGKATFHPSGRYLLVGCENEHSDHGLKNIPGIGDDYDLWMIDLQSGAWTRLTRLPAGSSIQYPRFSRDGSTLVWSQRYQKVRGAIFRRGQEFGFWKIMFADVEVVSPPPRLGNIRAIEPGGRGYYEPHGFSPDGTKLIFSGMFAPGQPQTSLDIFTYDLASRALSNLTNSPGIHDEMSMYSPDGRRIALMSGTFVGWFPEFGYKTDLYLMDADGGNRVQLTRFNDPGSPDYLSHNSQLTKLSWSPDGSKIVFGIYVHKVNEYFIYALNFAGNCGNLL